MFGSKECLIIEIHCVFCSLICLCKKNIQVILWIELVRNEGVLTKIARKWTSEMQNQKKESWNYIWGKRAWKRKLHIMRKAGLKNLTLTSHTEGKSDMGKPARHWSKEIIWMNEGRCLGKYWKREKHCAGCQVIRSCGSKWFPIFDVLRSHRWIFSKKYQMLED